ncbi:hypothetical protein MPK70_gp046 [Erwinia phage pEa_SNUABM_33]|uniref:Uncharacterized protein n=1 Tax=Erwinia phage pEa_SNUABM_33 TaxID=2869556 RepID=A0AAE7XKG7_9CAUD|nr:hypothetical protein MPK70_gp046 [Erwinia phage pEa_SNUABM_33]QZE57922.1 hypothetical protein pEaSNUABM33_00046 [Erwinia phage pEa_SNUABM_33]
MNNDNFMLIKRLSAFLYVGYAEHELHIPRRGVQSVHVVIPDPKGDDEPILDMQAQCIYHLPHNCFILQARPGAEGNETMCAMKSHCKFNEGLFQKSVHGREQAAINLILNELRDAETDHPTWPEECIHAASIVVEEAGELLRDCATFEENGDARLIENMRIEAMQTGAMALRFLKNLPFSQKRTIPNKAIRSVLESDMTPEQQVAEMRKLLDLGEMQ